MTDIYEVSGSETKVTMEAEYLVPVPVVGKLAEALIIKLNEMEAGTVLANLKARMEN